MCWVLDGGLRCASVRERARSCACLCNDRVRLRVCSCVCVCVHLCACACGACPCVYACLFERMCGFVRFHRIAIPRVCAPRRCARPPIAAAACGINSSARAARRRPRAWLRFGATGRLSRAFGRRCHVDVPHGRRAMGCASLPHVCGRRRRRHLRHRRRLQLQRRQRHQPPRRVGEHRRRCAAGPGRGTQGGTTEVLRGTKGVV